ncbi:hypothetical protein N5J43_00730 [Pseudomonas nicosulfuronedens]|uniref:DUF6680 family protein n=1 Tax=Pseudomonas nicosulfuronedens TaxID=2571105 RepID=UPI00244BDE26|nr:DUF6680 family protein [Pseudomonas nicosulfuronedens]MDH1007405.1 hypothetical protein [Pseudomonas nicosulfuronedens]MDH1977451.1 hypothetical protein [Pseudomonas nicosulfuronedens]MDH2029023.1 hypothetical protein [Pseudomonas nicosulfuronedens]
MENTWVFAISTIIATLLGPILAVQAQKYVERSRARRDHKTWVFQTLMATRGAVLSPDHVRALNMIDVVFYGKKVFGFERRSRAETVILDCWHEYLDHLNGSIDEHNYARWGERREELLVRLLEAIAADVGYRFDRVQLKNGGYSPQAHGNLEQEQARLRSLAIQVLSGEQPVKMHVESLPIDPAFAQAQQDLQIKLNDALNGKGALSVTIQQTHDQAPAPSQ